MYQFFTVFLLDSVKYLYFLDNVIFYGHNPETAEKLIMFLRFLSCISQIRNIVFPWFYQICTCLLIYLQFDWSNYNPETAERLIVMDKDQAAQKLHFVSDHFVLKANMEMYMQLFWNNRDLHTFKIHLRLYWFTKL